MDDEPMPCIKCGKNSKNGLCGECQSVKCRICGKVYKPNVHGKFAGNSKCPNCRKLKSIQDVGIPLG